MGHYGPEDVFYVAGNGAMNVRFEVMTVKALMSNSAVLGDASWRHIYQGIHTVFRRGDLFLQVDVIDEGCWLFGLEGRADSSLSWWWNVSVVWRRSNGDYCKREGQSCC